MKCDVSKPWYLIYYHGLEPWHSLEDRFEKQPDI